MRRRLPAAQRGAALAVGLVLLVIMTLLGVSGMTGASLQEQMAGNDKRQIDAGMAAEAGLAHAIQWLFGNVANWQRLKDDPAFAANAGDNPPPGAGSPLTANFDQDFRGYQVELHPVANPASGQVERVDIISRGYVIQGGEPLAAAVRRAAQALVCAGPAGESVAAADSPAAGRPESGAAECVKVAAVIHYGR